MQLYWKDRLELLLLTLSRVNKYCHAQGDSDRYKGKERSEKAQTARNSFSVDRFFGIEVILPGSSSVAGLEKKLTLWKTIPSHGFPFVATTSCLGRPSLSPSDIMISSREADFPPFGLARLSESQPFHILPLKIASRLGVGRS